MTELAPNVTGSFTWVGPCNNSRSLILYQLIQGTEGPGGWGGAGGDKRDCQVRLPSPASSVLQRRVNDGVQLHPEHKVSTHLQRCSGEESAENFHFIILIILKRVLIANNDIPTT